jgi:hypothetical protein
MAKQPASADHIVARILVARGHKVMLDADLAELYGVPTKRLNEQVKRNTARFPGDFMFRLTREELESLDRSHFATGSRKHRDPRYLPFAFTEHGSLMAATLLIPLMRSRSAFTSCAPSYGCAKPSPRTKS